MAGSTAGTAMSKWLVAGLLTLLAVSAEAQIIPGLQTSQALPIGAAAPYRQNLIASVRLDDALADQVYLIVFNAQVSPYYANTCPASCRVLPYEMAATTAIYAFDDTAPAFIMVSPRPCFPPATINVVAPCQGEDISTTYNYYSKVSRSALYQPASDGPVVIGLYGWGLSFYARPGDAAWVNPVTVKVQAVRLQ